MKALVVEGGAMRSIYSAGLLDGFIQHQFNPFDFYIGVSAGAYNLATYISGSPRKSLFAFKNFALNRKFISLSRFLLGGHLLDLDWLGEMAFSESLIDIDSVYKQDKAFYVCLTNIITGNPVYIKTNSQNLKSVVKASTALPLLYRNFPLINGQAMTDGGVADSIPVAEAIRMGASQIMVVRARHRLYLKKDTLGHRFVRWKMKHYPDLVSTMSNRVNIHKGTIELIRNPPPGINIQEVCPPCSFTMGRFSQNSDQLLTGYQSGFESAEETIRVWGSRMQ